MRASKARNEVLSSAVASHHFPPPKPQSERKRDASRGRGESLATGLWGVPIESETRRNELTVNALIGNEENPARTDEAYRRLKLELSKLRTAELKRLNVNVTSTVQQVLHALPRLRSLRDDLSNVLPTFDQRLFDRLEDCALVFAAARARHEAVVPDDGGARLLEQATELRKVLICDAGRCAIAVI